MSKYDPLAEFLGRQKTPEVPLRFSDIEAIVGGSLPPSAHTHRAWWSNNPSNNAMTKAWLAGGYRAERVNLADEKVTFRRVSPISNDARPARSTGAPAKRAVVVHPLFGRLKGMIRIEADVDLTAPADPDWGKRS
jgi:hypothetical protein